MMKSIPRARIAFLCLALVGYMVIAGSLDWLDFDPAKDEVHFWQTSLEFADQPLPSLDLLRSYGELNTPLPFVAFGWVEALLGQGIKAGRWLNAFISFAILCLFVLSARSHSHRVILAAIGAWSFPYLLGVSFYLYTDMMACAAAFLGLVAFRRSRWVTATIAFVLAISCRQYMIAIPAAIALERFVHHARTGGIRLGMIRNVMVDPAMISSMVGVASLAGWILLFGGIAPQAEMQRQAIQTAEAPVFLVQNGLYFLAAVGAYFVIPEWVLIHRARLGRVRGEKALFLTLLALGGLAVLFIAFPPMKNINYPIETMGFLDKAVRRILPEHDVARMLIFWVCAALCLIRFRAWSLATAVIVVHAVMLTKAHIAWDKYALPCLICLWYLSADAESPSVKNYQ